MNRYLSLVFYLRFALGIPCTRVGNIRYICPTALEQHNWLKLPWQTVTEWLRHVELIQNQWFDSGIQNRGGHSPAIGWSRLAAKIRRQSTYCAQVAMYNTFWVNILKATSYFQHLTLISKFVRLCAGSDYHSAYIDHAGPMMLSPLL